MTKDAPSSVPGDRWSRTECFLLCQSKNMCHGIFHRNQLCSLNLDVKEVQQSKQDGEWEYWEGRRLCVGRGVQGTAANRHKTGSSSGKDGIQSIQDSGRHEISITSPSKEKADIKLTTVGGRQAKMILGYKSRKNFKFDLKSGQWMNLPWDKNTARVRQFAYDMRDDRLFWNDEKGSIYWIIASEMEDMYTFYRRTVRKVIYGIAIDSKEKKIFFSSKQKIGDGFLCVLASAVLKNNLDESNTILKKKRQIFTDTTTVALDESRKTIYVTSWVMSDIWSCDYVGKSCRSLGIRMRTKFLTCCAPVNRLLFTTENGLVGYDVHSKTKSLLFKGDKDELECFLLIQEGVIIFYNKSMQLRSRDLKHHLRTFPKAPSLTTAIIL